MIVIRPSSAALDKLTKELDAMPRSEAVIRQLTMAEVFKRLEWAYTNGQ